MARQQAAPSSAELAQAGLLQYRSGDVASARRSFEAVLAREPELAETHFNLALTLEQLSQLDEACSEYEAALRLKPVFVAAALGLLSALRSSAKYERAIAWYEQHAAQLPDTAALHCAVAAVLADLFRIDEAVLHLERALELEPGLAAAHAELAGALLERGEIEQALEQMRRAIELEPMNATYHGNLVYLLPFSPKVSAAQVLEEARTFGARHAPAMEPSPRHSNSREPERKLRVGYVSPDFREHPAALFLRPLFREHDRERVHVIAYSNVRRPDAVTEELRSLVDDWRDISALDDESAASLIRRDNVDTLIDLAQHSAGNRLLLFARKPAPVQISWLGYPGTTGVAAIDYRLTDPGLDPPELGNGQDSESLLWLPDTFWCYEPPAHAPAVNELPALKNGYVTFGSLNSFKKASDAALELWTRVLNTVPGSRLLLVAPAGSARERVRRALRSQGVGEERVEMLGHMPRRDYFASYRRIDVGLDPVPYGGGTTTLDAAWMGVPVVTLAGESAVSRSGAAIARNLQLPELVGRSGRDYVERAAALADNLKALADLRRGLRERLAQSSLMDAPGFARGVERAFAEAWRRWRVAALVTAQG